MVALAVLGLSIGTFSAGRWLSAPPAPVVKATPIVVWAPVELRPLTATRQVPGTFRRAAESQLVLAGLEPPSMVLRVGPRVGAVLTAGFMAEVSGKPYFALPGPLPLYRDLGLGSAGLDVTFLQQSLTHAGYPCAVTGEVTWDTIEAVSLLFDSAGEDLPRRPAPPDPAATTADPVPRTEPFIPHGQLRPLTIAGSVVSVAAEGASLGPDTPLITTRAGADFVEFLADVEWAAELQPGALVEVIQTGQPPLPATIAEVGEFQEGKNGSPSGRAVRVEIAPDVAQRAGLQPETMLSVRESVSGESGLVVPLTAIRGMSPDTRVIVRAGETQSSRPVTVKRAAGGFAIVEGELSVGDQVLVS